MNAIYLILIALGFSAGIIVSVVDSDTNQTQNINIDEDMDNCNNLEAIQEPETKVNILDIID